MLSVKFVVSVRLPLRSVRFRIIILLPVASELIVLLQNPRASYQVELSASFEVSVIAEESKLMDCE